jgi:hypothetical protein
MCYDWLGHRTWRVFRPEKKLSIKSSAVSHTS